ncbi:MAG: hypothetical protein K6B40_04110 [Firmicutes bacterium]|nr:hypothetical protein [Bacillota bacterium]
MSDEMDNIKNEAKETMDEVREEAREVVEEVKAAVKGETLDTADTVGGAGYRANDNSSNGLAVASLVLGIISLVCAFLGWGAILGLATGIAGTVLGAKARKISQTGMATAGFVCSLIGLICSAAALLCVIACAGTLGALGVLGAHA